MQSSNVTGEIVGWAGAVVVGAGAPGLVGTASPAYRPLPSTEEQPASARTAASVSSRPRDGPAHRATLSHPGPRTSRLDRSYETGTLELVVGAGLGSRSGRQRMNWAVCRNRSPSMWS